MKRKTVVRGRNADKLSKDKIVSQAIAILDAGGEEALTFRKLAAMLETGSGAIYWHVSNKAELISAATDQVMRSAMAKVAQEHKPKEVIRNIALTTFHVIDEHPWVGNQLTREVTRGAMLQLGEDIGGQLTKLDLSGQACFDRWSVLINYILGVARQNALNAQSPLLGPDRKSHLTAIAENWTALPKQQYPFMVKLAGYLPDHDDSQQFMVGIDLILASIKN